MADFMTRLTERALGDASVVQPLIASTFAPGPTDIAIGLAWDGEPPASSGALDWDRDPLAVETPVLQDAPEKVPENNNATEGGEQGALTPIAPPPSEASDVSSSEPRRLAGPASKRVVAPEQEGQRNLLAATPEFARGTPQLQPEPSSHGDSGWDEREVIVGRDQQGPPRVTTRRQAQPLSEARSATLHRAEHHPTRREALPASRVALPERLPLGTSTARDEPTRAVSRPTVTLANRGQDATPVSVPPSPVPEPSLGANEGMPETKAASDRLASPAAVSQVEQGTVRPLLDGHPEPGPRELRATGPEPPAPTIRVAIGRIEVRATTPPPVSPAQQTAHARPSMALSLDDYLKQRNGGQR